jgi:hypothetical protein
MTALVVALGLAVALLAVLVVGLLRSHAEILKALHDLGVNLEDGAPATTTTGAALATSSRAPMRTAPGVPRPRGEDAPFGPAVDLSGALPTGGAAHAAIAGVDHSTLLAFLSTGCGTCGTFWDALGRHGDAPLPGDATRLVIVTNGADSESPAAVADLAPKDVLTLMSSEAWDAYQVPVSPYFVLVDGRTSQVIGEGAGTSWSQILDLLERAVGERGSPPKVRGRAQPRLGGQDRADRVDAELLAAGITPGDPSLYPAAHPSHDADGDDG